MPSSPATASATARLSPVSMATSTPILCRRSTAAVESFKRAHRGQRQVFLLGCLADCPGDDVLGVALHGRCQGQGLGWFPTVCGSKSHDALLTLGERAGLVADHHVYLA